MKTVSFIAASSNSGKTTLIEKVVRILKDRGLRVAVIKHASKGFELDRPGKDSWRFRKAGADAVMLVGPDDVALMKKTERQPSSEELELWAGDVDIVIREGFKQEGSNRIEVFRGGVSGELPLCVDDRSIIALVSSVPIVVAVPRFDWNDAVSVADFITKL
jgi:molybdopterin-guanine dinucleotide biosynthesis protein B